MATMNELYPPGSIHRSYPKQREGHKSRNPIIFICDWLFKRGDPKDRDGNVPCFYPIFAALWLFCIFVIPFERPRYDEFPVPTWVFSILVIFLLPDQWYRHYRHKYLKKHYLPGPYGWGTIDEFPHWKYKTAI